MNLNAAGEEEVFGYTCAHLIPLGAVPKCRTALGDS